MPPVNAAVPGSVEEEIGRAHFLRPPTEDATFRKVGPLNADKHVLLF